MTCHCSTRLTARIVNATAATFYALRGAKLSGWESIESSRVDAISWEQIDIVLNGYGDRSRVERGLRELVTNAVEVRTT